MHRSWCCRSAWVQFEDGTRPKTADKFKSRKPTASFFKANISSLKGSLVVFFLKNPTIYEGVVSCQGHFFAGVVQHSRREYAEISYLESCVRLFLVEEVEKPSMWTIQRAVCHPVCVLFVLLKLESNHAQATNDIHVFEDWC